MSNTAGESTPARHRALDRGQLRGGQPSAAGRSSPLSARAPDDLVVLKRRFSALVQGSSGLDQILRQRGIDTLIIVGTATNVCCESTLRDDMMMNYKCVMVSDANATRTDEEHNATLSTVAVIFDDVRTMDEVLALLNARPNTTA